MLAQQIAREGHARIPALLDAERCAALAARFDAASVGAGSRDMLATAWCRALANELLTHPLLRAVLPPVAVQCTAFDKQPGNNWLVPLHQDLSIPVAYRVAHAALAGWAQKQGTWFVQPPAGVVAGLLAVRLHLDDCDAHNGALRVVAGSHRFGRLNAEDVSTLRADSGETLCAMRRGDAHVLHPLLLHASSKADHPQRRRVLHFLFGPGTLPFGLAWPEHAAHPLPTAT